MNELPPLPPDVVEQLNATRGGFNETLGLRFTSVAYDEVIGEFDVGPQHLQPYGLVHGGVYASVIETLASTGAAINALPNGRHTVGLENNTSLVRAAREGRLRATATPVTRGRRTQVWAVTIRDHEERVIATGRVRLLCIEQGAALAGREVAVEAGA